MKIQKGDTVIVIKGADRKKSGKVSRVIRETGAVLVEGINVRARHKKAETKEKKGSIERREMPIDISNVAILDPGTKKRTRVGFKKTEKGKERVTRSGTILKKAKKKSGRAKKTVAAAEQKEKEEKK